MDKIKLMLEAFWLAQELNYRLKVAADKGELYKGHKLLRVTGKAWQRYNRRMASVNRSQSC